ncbi:MAG: hypothetical protein LBT21_01940 [Oscillospiraceae bacterium]|jgi:hypothetical protein|nr:hypothetical protein [Oscillospiraceae bacterium]
MLDQIIFAINDFLGKAITEPSDNPISAIFEGIQQTIAYLLAQLGIV